METLMQIIVVPLMFAVGALIIQRRTRTVWALWLSFALALTGGIVFAASPVGDSITGFLGAWYLIPVILGSIAVAVAATDAVDGRPEQAATIAAFFTPLFVPGMLASLDNPYILATTFLLIAFVSQHRAVGQRAGRIKWVSVLFALAGGFGLLKTSWVSTVLDFVPEWVPQAAGFLAILFFLIDIIADQEPDRLAIICTAVLPALAPYGWRLVESGLERAFS